MMSPRPDRALEQVISAGPFEATWESLQSYSVPEWYEDGKFGIFIHWGPYAVPAFENEWYPRNMYLKDSNAYKHHVGTYGPQTTFGYKDFIPRFSGPAIRSRCMDEPLQGGGGEICSACRRAPRRLCHV